VDAVATWLVVVFGRCTGHQMAQKVVGRAGQGRAGQDRWLYQAGTTVPLQHHCSSS
jgi:hypothetical protein